MTILIAILGLIFLIFIHELGHMLTAKAFGVRVPEFAIGFGPALLQKQFGKTTYSFRIILLGGFAKIAGMGDDEVPKDRRSPHAQDEASGGVSTWIEGGLEPRDGEAGAPRREADDLPAPDTYYAKAGWKRALIIFAGPAVNLLFALLIFSGIFMVQGVPTSPNPQPEAEVRAVAPGTMAAESGLEPGDRLVAVGGEAVRSWEGFTDAIGERSPGDEVSITIQRGGEEQVVTGDLGAAAEGSNQAQVGISPSIGEVSHSPFLALWEGMQQTVSFVGTYLNGLYQLATGQLGFFDNVSGPVGITSVGSEAVSSGVYAGLGTLAIISMILGIMNLLPILPLDGGHLLFIAAEKLRGRPITEESMNKVALVGVMLFLTLFLFATYADVSKIITGQPFIPQ